MWSGWLVFTVDKTLTPLPPPPSCFHFRAGAVGSEILGNSPIIHTWCGPGSQGLQLSWHPHLLSCQTVALGFSTLTSGLLLTVTTLFSDGELRHLSPSGSGSVSPPGVGGDHMGSLDIYPYQVEVRGLPFSLLGWKTRWIVRAFTATQLKQGKDNYQRQRRISYNEKFSFPGRHSNPKCVCKKHQSYEGSEAKTD